MYGIFKYHKNLPNVGKYTIHGWYGFHSPELVGLFPLQEAYGLNGNGNGNGTTQACFLDACVVR